MMTLTRQLLAWSLLGTALSACAAAPSTEASVSVESAGGEAVSASTVCNAAADCAESCGSGDGRSCARLLAFGSRADLRAWRAQAEPTLRAACDAGTARACWALARAHCFAEDDDGSIPGDCDALLPELLRRGCDAGEGQACSDLAYVSEDMPDDEREALRARGADLLSAACGGGAGEYEACLALEIFFLGSDPESERLSERLTAACHDEGDAIACATLAEGYEADDPVGAENLFDVACSAAPDLHVCAGE